LSYKRLERGRFVWPAPAAGDLVSISASQLAYMLDGIDWRNPQQTWRPRLAEAGDIFGSGSLQISASTILMHSGIDPAGQLRQYGITVIVDARLKSGSIVAHICQAGCRTAVP
jgi:hypothetical protein